MNTINTPHRRSAFTLIELLLVMVILVVLAAVVVPRFAGRTEQAAALYQQALDALKAKAER